MRLYWTAYLCYDANRQNSLELLKVLWTTNDFMTQVTERNQANMHQHLKWFLEFCDVPEHNSILFREKSIEGYAKYRKLLKLYLAENNIFTVSDMSKAQYDTLLKELLKVS